MRLAHSRIAAFRIVHSQQDAIFFSTAEHWNRTETKVE